MLIRYRAQQTDDTENKSVTGFTYKFRLVGSQNDTPIDLNDFDLKSIPVDCWLYRMGEKITNFNEHLQPLAMACSFSKSDYFMACGLEKIVIREATPTSVEEAIISCTVDFQGGIINLKGDDRLEFRAELLASCVRSGGTIDANELTLEVLPVEGVGTEFYTPIIRTKVVQQNEGRFLHNLRDNNMGIYLIRIPQTDDDKAKILAGASLLEDDKIFEKVSLRSNVLDFHDDYYEAVTKRNKQFPTLKQSLQRQQSFCFYSSTVEADKAGIDILFKSDMVPVASTYLVSFGFEQHNAIIERAVKQKRKHTKYKANKVKLAATPERSKRRGR